MKAVEVQGFVTLVVGGGCEEIFDNWDGGDDILRWGLVLKGFLNDLY